MWLIILILSFICQCDTLNGFALCSVRTKIFSSRRSPTRSRDFSVRASNTNIPDAAGDSVNTNTDAVDIVKSYFTYWNARDMSSAVSLFASDCTYEDTQYSSPFVGQSSLSSHLKKVSAALPLSFQFEIDEISCSPSLNDPTLTSVGVQWHVSSITSSVTSTVNSTVTKTVTTPLPFTRGCSMYLINSSKKIISGFDVPEPAPIKQGSFGLSILSLASKVIKKPIRVLPLGLTLVYCYVIFFSNIIPGQPLQNFEERTWSEVLNLSLNFFLVAPILKLPFSESVHPGLEGIFNLLLSWAALFSGFLSEGIEEYEKEEEVGVTGFAKCLVGMQFLTSAFFLPYLGVREEYDEGRGGLEGERVKGVYKLIGENRVVPGLLSFVGTGSIFWGLFGRPEFGDFNERFTSLNELLSIDRVGSSFIVDLVVFGLFQGWLVDDDVKRRGGDKSDFNVLAAKFIPFFGLAFYLLTRPQLLNTNKNE